MRYVFERLFSFILYVATFEEIVGIGGPWFHRRGLASHIVARWSWGVTVIGGENGKTMANLFFYPGPTRRSICKQISELSLTGYRRSALTALCLVATGRLHSAMETHTFQPPPKGDPDGAVFEQG